VTVRVTRYLQGGQYFAMALDDYGQVFEPGAAVALGQTIAPTEPMGFAYEVKSAGTLPAVEPPWWTNEVEPREVGTAVLQPARVFAPSVYGPLALDVTLDEHWDSVVALYPFDGPDLSTTVTDESTRARAFSLFGAGSTLRADIKRFGASSLYFPGTSGCYGTIGGAADQCFDTDMTLELWIYPLGSGWSAGTSYEGILSKRPGNSGSTNREWSMVKYEGFLTFVLYGPTGAQSINLSFPVEGNMPAGVWHHTAVTREGGTIRLYLNGAKMAQGVPSLAYGYSTASPIQVSQDYSGRPFHGYMDDLRITRGVARYTGDTFDVPAAPNYHPE
jgi:hypothetical protein